MVDNCDEYLELTKITSGLIISLKRSKKEQFGPPVESAVFVAAVRSAPTNSGGTMILAIVWLPIFGNSFSFISNSK